MRLVNLTPHMISILVNNEILLVPAQGKIARVATKKELISTLLVDNVSIPVFATTFGEVELTSPDGSINEPFPAPEKGTLYIVSSIVKNAMMDRENILVPTDFVRDDRGNIIGCQALSA